MRNVDVYGKSGNLRVFIDGEEYKQVLAVNPPARDQFANVVLSVDGKVTFHGDVKPPEEAREEPAPDVYDDFRVLIERVTVMCQKGKITQKDYDDLLRNLKRV